ncbi:MAG TPA: M20/M25/M40 family metallo-hydrolase [Thermoanaerobaculia bacterium]|nr:M20/M25/M40 family metallo-hydrolase [Thermoanaerobaculia bacterium]
MKLRKTAWILPALLLGSTAATAADDIDARIAGAAMTQGGAAAFLETLTDTVGGRVTGSPESLKASQLILDALKRAGYENARFEEAPLEARWTRGPAAGRIVSPISRAIAVGSYAWVPGTSGEVTATLLDMGEPKSFDAPLPQAVRGAAVLVDPQQVGVDPSFVMRSRLAKRLAEAGAAAMLLPSDKPGRMVYTSAFGFYPRGPLPVLSVAAEDSALLRRLLAKGPVRIALDVRNTFDTSPYKERNVVADLPGSDLKDEVVLLGAHLDSWDPAQGADDDGTGVAALVDAARILKSLGVTPRRTIRFAFFFGEEEACLGSRAYVTAHEKELDRLRAVLVMDSGAGKPRGIESQGRTDAEPAIRAVLARTAPLGASEIHTEATFDRDNGPFMVAGIPAFTLWVDDGDYDKRHHAPTDTFEHVDQEFLARDTAIMAIAARAFADAPAPPAKRQSAAEAVEFMKKVGVEGTKKMVYVEQ